MQILEVPIVGQQELLPEVTNCPLGTFTIIFLAAVHYRWFQLFGTAKRHERVEIPAAGISLKPGLNHTGNIKAPWVSWSELPLNSCICHSFMTYTNVL
jgi:hypothetical protein